MRKLLVVLIVMLLANVSFGATFNDDMEYADEAALDAAWFNTTPGWWTGGDWPLNTTISKSGSQSMEMLDDGGATNRGGNRDVAGGVDHPLAELGVQNTHPRLQNCRSIGLAAGNGWHAALGLLHNCGATGFSPHYPFALI